MTNSYNSQIIVEKNGEYRKEKQQNAVFVYDKAMMDGFFRVEVLIKL